MQHCKSRYTSPVSAPEVQAISCLLDVQYVYHVEPCACMVWCRPLASHGSPGVKQLEKLIRKRLEEKRKDRAMRKATQKAEELARGQQSA